MADPIANGSLSLVVGDPDHTLGLKIVLVDDAPQLAVSMSLALRGPNGKMLDRLEGSFNLTQAATSGVVSPDDVAAMRRVLVALGQKLAADAGLTVTQPGG